MGFACNALAYGVIRRAGSLTLKVLGTVKNVAVVGAGMALFGDRVGVLQAVGYAVSIAGFVSYQRVKVGGGGGGGSGSGGKEEAATTSNSGEVGGGGGGAKIETVSSFIIPASSQVSSSLSAADIDVTASATAGEKAPLLPASFGPATTLVAHDSTSSLLSSASAVSSSSVSAAALPLSTVDAISAKLSGFFSFGGAGAGTTGAANEIAAGRV